MNKFYYLFLVLLLFIVSGVKKSFNFNDTVNYLKSSINLDLPYSIYTMAIILVILLQVIGSLYILYNIKNNNINKYNNISNLLKLLALFTIIVTPIFHSDDLYAILKNTSIVGSLLYIANDFKN